MRGITRRDCLRSGIALGFGPAILGLPGARLLANAVAPPAREPGLPERYLGAGLAALASVGSGYWSNGHWGASVIAAWFFARELELDEPALRAIQSELDAFQAGGKEHFESDLPEEKAVPERIDEIARSIEQGMDGLRGAGHGVIFSTLALKAFRHQPSLALPKWIDGVLALDRLIRERFRPDPDTDYNRAHPIPAYSTPGEMMESALTALVRRPRLLEEIGPVGLIHVVTFADALADLWEMGFESLAVRGSEALRIRINVDPASSGRESPLPEPSPDSPLAAGFWDSPAVRAANWGFTGHHFKFPYSYYRRRESVRDPETRKACDDLALRLLVR